MTKRPPYRRLDGVLLLDKARGVSSNAALQDVKRLFNARKAGHTGTLDPLATGLLPLCFGEATKFSHALFEADKRYVATLALGVRTDTGDAEGRVVLERPVGVTAQQVQAVLADFTGWIEQVPPMHSALKRDGRPLYELARRGLEVERAPRRVHIHAIELTRFDAAHPEIEVHCSKGTYIRTLAQDIGEALGCGAHLASLRRTAVGMFDVRDALTLDQVELLGSQARDTCLLPVDALLKSLARTDLEPDLAARFLHGQAVPRADARPGLNCRVYCDGRLLGIGQSRQDGLLAPLRLVSDT
jgi:tRNA pseudouridine55 synthase